MKILKGEEAKRAKKFLKAAAEASEKARCLKRPRGCVIVLNGKIISEGANAPADDHNCKECLRDKKKSIKFEEFNTEPCYSVHAEQRAILDAYKSGHTNLTGAKLYFTRLVDGKHSPVREISCTICSKFMLEASLKSFVCIREEGICEYSTQEMNDLSFERLEKPTAKKH